VWQIKDFKPCIFGSVARKRLAGAFFGCVANTGVSEKEIRLAREGEYPTPRFLQKSAERFECKDVIEFTCAKE
jgi:hypothetical protein